MNAKEVRDRVRSWVASVTGITTIHGWPNADAPAEPYAVVLRTISDAVHMQPAHEDFTEAGGVIRQSPLTETYWRFTVDAFGEDPEDYLKKIRVAWDVPTAMWPLRPLLLVEASRIVTHNEIRDQEFKGRAQMTIEVRGIVRDGLVIDVTAEQHPDIHPA